ncbi:STAS domain-containing protein [Jeotgalibacillus soli]|uniref:Modulator protein RsbR n=1 Tax=Jeotgalibacillus soli TaxID=889306 RepID=A0A0C2RDY6_9BACL|nr:STAS domain-containing protein [Jeotgalibacillus soli]KIL48475.1 modulator protein RsbR [Jeotgalibacillus soli]
MHRSKELHVFLLDRAKNLTEAWYESLDKSDPSGVYASTDPEVISTLKKQNYDFHLHLCGVFIEEERKFFNDFQQWILSIAQDEQHYNTPIHFTIREFFRVQDQYLDFIMEFVSLHEGEISGKTYNIWNRMIIKVFNNVMVKFVEEHQKFAEQKLLAQQEMIQELSSPIIILNKNTALLPLVGDIDTRRSVFILEHTLEQCSQKRVNNLIIDLSGVVMIDTMVAQQIFHLVDGLSLIGVKTTLSGIRPEIAQTIVQLGLQFDKISIKSTLAEALA